MKTILKWFGMYLYTMLIILITLFFTSCGASDQCYNVGTGKPMQRTCTGGWTGGQ